MLWGVKWRSESKLYGKVERLVYRDCLPLIFKTRREARESIEEAYGYLRDRPDLKAEPHGWKMPRAVKVKVVEIQ